MKTYDETSVSSHLFYPTAIQWRKWMPSFGTTDTVNNIIASPYKPAPPTVVTFMITATYKFCGQRVYWPDTKTVTIERNTYFDNSSVDRLEGEEKLDSTRMLCILRKGKSLGKRIKRNFRMPNKCRYLVSCLHYQVRYRCRGDMHSIV
jgi:hypothetical protein